VNKGKEEAGVAENASLLDEKPSYLNCLGALKAAVPALRIITMLCSLVNSGVVLVALRCPCLAAAKIRALAVASSGA
jgi:hypothetical protein